MFKLIIKIAFRYLKSNKYHFLPSLVSTISFLSIFISIGTLIIVTAVQNGFRTELIKQIVGINAHISIVNNYDGIQNYQSVVDAINKIADKQINAVIPMVDGKGMLVNTKNNASAGVVIKGIQKDDMLTKGMQFKTFDANLDRFVDNAIILGSDLAFSLGAFPGATVTLVSPEINETIFGIIPRTKTYNVVGIANFGLSQYNDILAFVPLDQAQKFFRYPKDTVSTIEVLTSNPERADDIMKKIYLPDGGYITNWQQQNAGLMNALKMEKNIMILIISMFVIAAIFSIFAGLTMMIHDKYKSIAILRSMGFSRLHIGIVFFLVGMIINVSATISGVLVGSFLAVNINTIKVFLESLFGMKLFDSGLYFVSSLPSDLHTSDVIYIVLFVAVLSVISSIIPAFKATKYQPAEALKYF